MGGNALKNINVIRINLETLYFIQNEIYNKLINYVDIYFPIENPDKKDFGDIDILYSNKNYNFNLYDYIVKIYKPIQIVVNGDVISFSYKYNNNFIQVDLIKCKNLLASKYFYSYGDFGLILGQIVNYYGLKFGQNGLYILITSNHIGINDNINEKLELTNNLKEICLFFNLDFKLWGSFKSEEEIFEWFCNSSYFSKNIFSNMNSKQNHHKLTRPMYSRFIEYIEKIKLKDLEKEENLNRQIEAINYFNANEKLNEYKKIYKIKNDREKKFNGNKILELGLVKDQKDIGVFIKNFKKYIENDFDEWLDCNTNEIIDKTMIIFYKKNQIES